MSFIRRVSAHVRFTVVLLYSLPKLALVESSFHDLKNKVTESENMKI